MPQSQITICCRDEEPEFPTSHFLVDETKCASLDGSSGWQGRTKYIWNSCLITSTDGKSYDYAKQDCTQFYGGHLVILDTVEKETQFNNTMANV